MQLLRPIHWLDSQSVGVVGGGSTEYTSRCDNILLCLCCFILPHPDVLHTLGIAVTTGLSIRTYLVFTLHFFAFSVNHTVGIPKIVPQRPYLFFVESCKHSKIFLLFEYLSRIELK